MGETTPGAAAPYRQISDICIKRFPSRLRQAIAERGFGSAKAAARRAGIADSSLALLMSGKRSPSGETVSRLAMGLGVSADWLLGFDVEMDGTPSAGGRCVPSVLWEASGGR